MRHTHIYFSFPVLFSAVMFILFIPTLFLALGISSVFSADKISVNSVGLMETGKEAGLPQNQSLPAIIGKTVSAVLGILGTIFLLIIVVAGIRWMTAAGNDEQVTKARSMIIAAFLGLLVVFLAYALVQTVGYIITSMSA